MRRLILILGDQLSPSLSALADLDPQADIVLMAEVAEEAQYVPHHKQKLVLLWSAMRHFAEGLRADGTELDVEMVLGRAEVDGEVHYTASLFDLTAQRQAAVQIERQREQLAHGVVGAHGRTRNLLQ